ncbi:SnoaL-like domain-containing protein [Pseudomaricurvus alkylphenolicus]|uniref:nuclear transport factor 2 family protein n=1 Tax=Pseudomaricurvus alkylphenolicus TaxID=1306991 RepID=UPI001423C786|nr:nuclear transport factor 2 family protein [Pseudomaricurvus alkylphenolicus]NIB37990.1 SnoaL-like domain-containing protein [Pseudomaricurvus alkylphenolicus]
MLTEADIIKVMEAAHDTSNIEREDHIRSVFQTYADAFSNDDIETVLGLFADDAVLEDPVDTTPIKGKADLRVFYQFAMAHVDRIVLEGNVRAGRNKGSAAMLVYAKSGDSISETTDVMEFNEEGKIVSMKAYWGAGNTRPL